ncbi:MULTISPECIES: hypothetical protein [Nonomuraea]|uniref:Uncharacterized protein n=2 Tax=Nonomuraea TaxID=83681 RepID=A0ABW1C1R6_9ACTN|nr:MULTISPECIES: hypothetical protein [Nonomuraea]MDA0644091.1 hypothetical protein [Nonomuraea ferruginea]
MSEPQPDVVSSEERTHALEAELNALRARADKVDQQLQALAEASLALARGLESPPVEEPGQPHAERAARLAHELLLAAGLGRRGSEGSEG